MSGRTRERTARAFGTNVPEPELRPDKVVVRSWRASRVLRWSSVRGRLVLTSERVLFLPTMVAAGDASAYAAVELGAIASIRREGGGGVARRALAAGLRPPLALEHVDGKVERFALWRSDDAIRRLTAAFSPANGR